MSHPSRKAFLLIDDLLLTRSKNRKTKDHINILYKREPGGTRSYREIQKLITREAIDEFGYGNNFLFVVYQSHKLYGLNRRTSQLVEIEWGGEYKISDYLYPYVWLSQTDGVREVRHNIETGERLVLPDLPDLDAEHASLMLSKDVILITRGTSFWNKKHALNSADARAELDATERLNGIWIWNEKEAIKLVASEADPETSQRLDSGSILEDAGDGELVLYDQTGRAKQTYIYRDDESYSDDHPEAVEKLVLPRNRLLINSEEGVKLIDLDSDRVIEVVPDALLVGEHYSEDTSKREDMEIACSIRVIYTRLLNRDLIGLVARYTA